MLSDPMEKQNAKTFAHNINESFSDDSVKARAEVHGENEAELVIDVNYRDEGPERLVLVNQHQALALFQIIYAAKEQGIDDGLGLFG